VWFREMTGALEERFSSADPPAVGTYRNIFIRNCQWVRMSNLALGHRDVRSTFWYLSAAPELLALAAGRLEADPEGRP
jgi:hypothetical protein